MWMRRVGMSGRRRRRSIVLLRLRGWRSWDQLLIGLLLWRLVLLLLSKLLILILTYQHQDQPILSQLTLREVRSWSACELTVAWLTVACSSISSYDLKQLSNSLLALIRAAKWLDEWCNPFIFWWYEILYRWFPSLRMSPNAKLVFAVHFYNCCRIPTHNPPLNITHTPTLVVLTWINAFLEISSCVGSVNDKVWENSWALFLASSISPFTSAGYSVVSVLIVSLCLCYDGRF